MSSFTKAVISFKIIIVRSTEFVNALEQAIFPTLSHKAPQFLCNLTVSSSREDMSQSGSSVPFNKERNPCPHCGAALSVSEFCKLCTINKAARPALIGRACCYFWSRIRESNPPSQLGKLLYYRCTNPAYRCIITEPHEKSNHFLSEKGIPVEEIRRVCYI